MIIALGIAVVVLGLLALAHEYMLLQNTRAINDHTEVLRMHGDTIQEHRERLNRLEGIAPCICPMTPEDPRPKPDCPIHGM